MQQEINDTGIPKFKTYLLELKSKVTDKEEYDRISYLEKKVKNAMTIAKKYSKKEGHSKSEFTITQVYIFLFYFRIFDTYQELSNVENKKLIGQKIIDYKAIYEDFNLSLEDQSQLTNALKDYSVPIDKNYSTGIKVGHDAITTILGKKKFIDKMNGAIDEFEFYFPSLLDNSEKYNQILDYISRTRFFSNAAQEKLFQNKVKNKNELIKYIQKQKVASSITNNKRAMTMVKTSSRNQIDLLSIADKKAGIMITVNSILLTILIPLFASFIFDFSSYLIPIVILVVTSGLTILFATFATRPSAGIKKEEQEELFSGERSIFYFKNFAQLSKDKFVDEAHDLLNRDEAFEKAVFTDLYDVGVDLDRKYKRLRWCYTIFASGIILTILSFVFSLLFL